MAYKQPRIPPLKEEMKLAEYIRELVFFLKDFCMETWMTVVQMQKANAERTREEGVQAAKWANGKAAEFIVNDGRLFFRSGDTTDGEEWRQIYDSVNRPVPAMSELLDLIYPVGSVYMSAGGVNPAVLFGGEWAQMEDAETPQARKWKRTA